MSLIWFEFTLSLRRLLRRPAQSGLMLATFTISLTLGLLSWSLFYTVFQYNPDFDPHGKLYVATYADSHAGSSRHHLTLDEFKTLQAGQTDFSDFAEITFYDSVFLNTAHGIERMMGANVSSSALSLIGAQPEFGRLFVPAEDKVGGPLSLILSHRVWKNRFGGDPNIIGKVVQIAGNSTTVVGVMPASFRFPNDQDIWLAMSRDISGDSYPNRDALVRLKPGVTPERAELDLQVILSRLGPDSPANKNHFRPLVVPFREFYLEQQARMSALVLFSLALLFIIVGCVNAANLMLIDFLGRQSEVATALALGIPKRATIRGLCLQVGVVASTAMLLSLGLLMLVAPLLHRALMTVNAPYWLQFSISPHHFWMAAVLAAASAGMALVAPISYLIWLRPDRVIRENLSASRGAGRARSRRLLLTGQIAVLTVLGVCAGLLARSSLHLSENPNYDARKVFMGSLSLRGAKDLFNADRSVRYAAYHHVLEGVSRLPGVNGAAYMAMALGYSQAANCAYALDPGAFVQNQPSGLALSSAVTDQLFATIGVPIIAGSTFPQTKPPPGWTYAVINYSLAERLWPRQDPLHRALYIRYDGADPKLPPNRLLVVGIMQDFQASGPMALNNDCIYTPLESLISSPYSDMPGTVFLLASGRVLPTAQEIGDAVQSIDPRFSLFFVSTVEEQIDVTLSSVHLTTRLTIIYAVAAVLLCGLGIYSLTVSQVLQSSREFGIRMALGAEAKVIWRRFIRGHVVNALIGILIGLIAAFQVARLLSALLFGVDYKDYQTFLGAAFVILAVAVLACLPSLFRLKRINPSDCLRSL